ncbi:uncharacterized protein SCHCODRAFT_02711678 [Schizophyllum commune H4-8]|uniref:Uncharacterized protein n=1 Tax=Schizophyllum commune (strain H4-8 / FGSC 9210) TaxID=578458 RepID=D8QET9_SCHCM|nr:uncharacterized protein SCHCODRAFT_02711678 [Schizophyllum commune H4-8]KAI5888146.1 hypothetical protein SCHCODRAFT_02711678 [Schizophyllum commune H4-8]
MPPSLDFTSEPQGMEPHMKLAGLAVQSLMMGIFSALVFAMVCLLCRHATPQDPSNLQQPPDRRRLLASFIILALMVTGHWICLVIRAFQGFVWRTNGEHPAIYFAEVNDPAGSARFAFHGATIVVADLFVIGRLYVICDYCKSVVVAPLLCLAGLVVQRPDSQHACLSSSLEARALDFYYSDQCLLYGYDRLAHQTVPSGHRLQDQYAYNRFTNAHFSLRIIYAFAQSVVIVITESAVLYTSAVLIAQVAYEIDHIASYFLVDSIPTIAALTAVLVHARAVLTKARDVYSGCEWRSHGLESEMMEDRHRAARFDGLAIVCKQTSPRVCRIWHELATNICGKKAICCTFYASFPAMHGILSRRHCNKDDKNDDYHAPDYACLDLKVHSHNPSELCEPVFRSSDTVSRLAREGHDHAGTSCGPTMMAGNVCRQLQETLVPSKFTLFPALDELCIDSSMAYQWGIWEAASAMMDSLRLLRINTVSPATLVTFANLQDATICHADEAVWDILSTLPHLTNLITTIDHPFSSDQPAERAALFPKLTRLSVSFKGGYNVRALRAVLSSACTRLSSLRIYIFEPPDLFNEHGIALPSYVCSLCSHHLDKHILRSLDVAFSESCTGSDLRSMSFDSTIVPLLKFNALGKLCLALDSAHLRIESDRLARIMEDLPKLDYLSLEGCYIPVQGLQVLAKLPSPPQDIRVLVTDVDDIPGEETWNTLPSSAAELACLELNMREDDRERQRMDRCVAYARVLFPKAQRIHDYRCSPIYGYGPLDKPYATYSANGWQICLNQTTSRATLVARRTETASALRGVKTHLKCFGSLRCNTMPDVSAESIGRH